jgi:hypothetical protein
MLVLGAFVAMLTIGVWLYGLIEVFLTSGSDCRYLPKSAWLAIVALTFVFGAIAWLFLGRSPTVSPQWSRRRPDPSLDHFRRGRTDLRAAAQARGRHPAGRARPNGPDDDPDFLRKLDYLIRDGHDTGNEL